MSSELTKPTPVEVVWHGGQIHPEDRSRLLGQSPITLWFTGLSASGKSTLAFALERLLVDAGRACYVLDGDNVRHGLNRNLGFSHEDRTENIRRIAEVAHLMNDAGLIVITAFISPYREDRRLAQDIIGQNRFFEIHVSTPLEICETRDPKGMYRRARSGEIEGFTGVGAPYEPPTVPAMAIDTSDDTIAACARKVLAKLADRMALPGSLRASTISCR